MRHHSYYCLLGLLAVSGLRISEALALQEQDVDLQSGILTIRQSKFRKSRLVPLHPYFRIEVCRFDRLVPEQFGNLRKRRSLVDHAGRKTVPEQM
jgi:integrase